MPRGLTANGLHRLETKQNIIDLLQSKITVHIKEKGKYKKSKFYLRKKSFGDLGILKHIEI